MTAATAAAAAVSATCVSLEGDIAGFLTSPCVFRLTIHGDGSLTGAVAPTDATGSRDECIDTYSLFDGNAIARAADASSTHALYDVRFQIAKLSDLPGVFFYIEVQGELSLVTGLHAKWNVAGSLGRADALEPDQSLYLPVVHEALRDVHDDQPATSTTPVVVLYPLTQGCYTLRGATIGDNGYLYRATWMLALHARGVVEGTSQEDDNAPQLCPLAGSWTRTHVQLLLDYVVHGKLGRYNYEGDVCGGGLRGRWTNLSNTQLASERGKLEFTCVEAVRRWNVEDHGVYPRAFQDVVRVCLFTSGGAARLPNLLWREVFSYCGFEWFRHA